MSKTPEKPVEPRRPATYVGRLLRTIGAGTSRRRRLLAFHELAQLNEHTLRDVGINRLHASAILGMNHDSRRS